jgi:hypothetical protein
VHDQHAHGLLCRQKVRPSSRPSTGAHEQAGGVKVCMFLRSGVSCAARVILTISWLGTFPVLRASSRILLFSFLHTMVSLTAFSALFCTKRVFVNQKTKKSNFTIFGVCFLLVHATGALLEPGHDIAQEEDVVVFGVVLGQYIRRALFQLVDRSSMFRQQFVNILAHGPVLHIAG